MDWRTNNAVTPVKIKDNVAVVRFATMEGAWAIHTGSLESLSEQQLIDCSLSYGDLACNGGEMDSAFRYAIDHGMCTEDEDPYQAASESCIDCDMQVTFSTCVDVTSNTVASQGSSRKDRLGRQSSTAAFDFIRVISSFVRAELN